MTKKKNIPEPKITNDTEMQTSLRRIPKEWHRTVINLMEYATKKGEENVLNLFRGVLEITPGDAANWWLVDDKWMQDNLDGG